MAKRKTTVILAYIAEQGPKTEYELYKDERLWNISHGTIHYVLNKLAEDRLLRWKPNGSRRGKRFSLTFRGVIAYLASISLTPPPRFGKPGEDVEAFKKRYVKEKSRYLNELEKLAQFLEFYGELLNYAIFKEIRWLQKRYGHHVYQNILDVAKFIEAFPPFPSQVIKGLKKQKHALKRRMSQHQKLPEGIMLTITYEAKTDEERYDPLTDIKERLSQIEQQLQILLDKGNEWWKRGFGERFFERIIHLKSRGEMHNKNLRRFAEECLKKKIEQEIEPWEGL